MKHKESNQEYQKEQIQSSLKGVEPGEILIGTLVGLDEQGNALVNIPSHALKEPITALSTVSLNQQQSGRQVALSFLNSDPEKPIIIGLIHSPLHEMIETFEMSVAEESVSDDKSDDSCEEVTTKIDDVYLNGERIVLEGKKEIVLKCGEASITLTRSGKILIRGTYLLNRSSGVNRIMGGSVQVN